MPQDKYTAVWVSHTSLSDFLNCPKAYFLKNVYKDPKTKHKIKLMSPPLALGQTVHEVLEGLSVKPVAERFLEPLPVAFERAWEKVQGRKGGFTDPRVEEEYKERGREMLKRVMRHPGPLGKTAVKIQQDLPFFWLSDEQNIILCGKIDWLEYVPETDSVHIIDFKTSKKEEDGSSLQLPIYHLLVHHCQKRTVSKASYWYLELSDVLAEKQLPSLEDARQKVMRLAEQVVLARKLERYKCPNPGQCMHCTPYERIIRGEAELVGEDEYRADVYILPKDTPAHEMPESILL